MNDGVPLTVAVLHRHVRGYPADCLRPIISSAPAGTEFLLLCGSDFDEATLAGEMPFLRVLRVEGGRASAKNAAVREAKERYLLLASSDTVAQDMAVPELLRFLDGAPDVIVSAQLLQENGMRRRTAYEFPAISRELNVRAGMRHFYARVRKGVLPPSGLAVAAPAFHATFLMASLETFRKLGPFQEGHRFACEDLEWCHRAKERGVERFVLPKARVLKMPPQLSGPLSPAERVALEAAIWRLMERLDGPGRAACFRGVRRLKSLIKWGGAFGLHHLTGRRSAFLKAAADSHWRTIWMRYSSEAAELPEDAESRFRWEMLF
jgi:GT2 family glycosyltransferase